MDGQFLLGLSGKSNYQSLVGDLQVSHKLTAKQEAFCQEYLIDLNAAQAAIRAGYSEKTAAVIGCENLTKPNIAEHIANLKAARSAKTAITAEYVLSSLHKVAERCMQEEAVTDSDGGSKGEFRFEHSGANKSLELLGRHLGLFVDKREISGAIEVARVERVIVDPKD